MGKKEMDKIYLKKSPLNMLSFSAFLNNEIYFSFSID